MLWIVLIPALLLLLLGPHFWVQHTLRRHSRERQDLPGTGGELAHHLINKWQLPVRLDVTPLGDHYDPVGKKVCLSAANHQGRSLTAAVVAAHEVGHAMQDQQGNSLLALRTRLMPLAIRCQQAGVLILGAIPLLAMISPPLAHLGMAMAVFGLSTTAVTHLLTLPMEIDASYNWALPALREGDYLGKADMVRAEAILRACALTYASASLASILNITRWLSLLRRR